MIVILWSLWIDVQLRTIFLDLLIVYGKYFTTYSKKCLKNVMETEEWIPNSTQRSQSKLYWEVMWADSVRTLCHSPEEKEVVILGHTYSLC